MGKNEFDLFAVIYLYLKTKISDRKLKLALYEWNETNEYFSQEEICSNGLLIKLTNIIENKSKNQADICLLIKTLLSIDYHFDKEVYKYTLLTKKPLNNLEIDKIMVFPKMKTIERTSGSYEHLSTYFQNLFAIIIKENLTYNVVNYYIENKEDYVNIAMLPMRIEGDNKNEKFLVSLNDAIENNYSIIISNELEGNEEIDEKVYDILCEHDSIFLVACPSFKFDKKNRTKIYCHEHHQIKDAEYVKHTTYTVRGKRKEENENDNIEFLLFHIEGIGSIGIVICKDFFSNYTKDLIDSAQLDIILVLSYTPTYDKFINEANNLVSKKRICLICNSCNEVKNNKDVLKSPAIVTYYVKKESNGEYKLIDTLCGFKCEEYDKCYFGVKVMLRDGILNVEEIKHILR